MTSVEQTADVKKVRERTFELTEFLHDILRVNEFPWANFPHKVGIHCNCNSLRGIHLAAPTEIKAAFFSKPKALLEKVAGIEFVEPARSPTRACRRHVETEPQPRGAIDRGHRPIDQVEASVRFIAASEHEKAHDERLWDMRLRRDSAAHALPEWEDMRALASAIKEHTLSHLDHYLLQFERAALANGAIVHWAADAAGHNRTVHDILLARNAKTLIKSKSMLTDECGFRAYMKGVGIEAIETDLGERIQQLDGEEPSHVIGPAIHKTRADVAEVFARTQTTMTFTIWRACKRKWLDLHASAAAFAHAVIA